MEKNGLLGYSNPERQQNFLAPFATVTLQSSLSVRNLGLLGGYGRGSRGKRYGKMGWGRGGRQRRGGLR